MRLLVVEDDPTISRFLVKGLREDQHLVDLAEDGDAAEASALSGDYDAILLDVMLPAQDGFTVCRRLRAQGVDTPILMVTARDAVGDRVHGLDTGADDYLVKPFAFDEVVARLRALTRRGRTRSLSAILTAGALSLDQEAHQARVAGTPVPLTATEYRLLEYLMRRAGTIVSRDQLAEHVWGGDYDPCSNVADVYVGYLRKKLAGTAAADQIRTIRGLGYMLDRVEA
ncbi:Transcriptional regulatory protein TcrA [Luteitalea pratensis]|uniref:Transcriptional regulatory protein TcrA n=1 Tax=Luteitalea pratensis TaxID=1855912 RepID=A0A143PF35_LUTPR|nr:response regulator transcription factor [Luteitalea pratensis]AMY07125.1 Transcriptional regulatory protein TcrA [Luteitalea pratensis]